MFPLFPKNHSYSSSTDLPAGKKHDAVPPQLLNADPLAQIIGTDTVADVIIDDAEACALLNSRAPAEHTTPSTSSGTANTQVQNRDKLHSAKAKTQLPQFKLQKSLWISINKITVQEGERVKVTENMLAKLPISSLHDKSTTEGYESTETEIYWPISPKPIEILNTPERDRQHKTEKPTLKQENLKLGRGLLQPRKRMIYAKPSQFMFKINTIGIKRKKPKYYFKCITNNCSKTFDNLQTWNTHH